MKELVIVSAARTPIGSFLGSLSSLSAVQLGSAAIEGALNKIKLEKTLINEVFMGNVLQANVGQAPAKQASLGAGIPNNVPCTTINKVCASGMKAVMIGAQSIQAGDNEIVVAGGMESMSQVPYYLTKGRIGNKLGDQKLVDGLLKDGLINVYDRNHMGICADACAEEYNISREEQDAFAIQSYTRSELAWKSGKFNDEVVPVTVPQRKKDPIIISEDEEFKNVNFDKLKQLSPVFQKEGTVTAANASTLNDGASALILMTAEKAKELGLQPLVKIISYADAACEPEKFTIAPSLALPKALKKANLSLDDIDFFEFNEAFSVVGLANAKILNIDSSKVNVNGGAVSLGHPLGNSGSRIIVTLIHVLKQNNAKYGAAAICNGGGGASAIILENI
ncbi:MULTISPECIES: acetyl-CoA C-acyltransferase [unclassified Apibacter]|uniref:acetyl-CoA C-acyltransferase n=1 Tax=unclassified Apibacter TaxID=2630820 RepID=UPI0013288629|nr:MULTISPECIES: acetyl-CoA C-acyltransferase [unclassified Apibacter]MCX8676907.1 acetyl-CoA C-acyltransferase [Apibacter sp. B3919]MXO24711.1 acetyl-CoA C-acyltransferase [Apibacter sp. B3924]MXO25955.1 acetyl-CoA C-acyltransferase [Apibacter sp. B3813]MXO27906.1 acetyl-CoA C-acyltransferase [Apibacter sp. B3913]MXO29734.1 acetyl-CoA C-acyltransferase [Apibacter sp. B3912]